MLTPKSSALNEWLGNVHAYLLLMVIFLTVRLISMTMLIMGYDKIMMGQNDDFRSRGILPNSGLLCMHILVILTVIMSWVMSVVAIEMGRSYLADESTTEKQNYTIERMYGISYSIGTVAELFNFLIMLKLSSQLDMNVATQRIFQMIKE